MLPQVFRDNLHLFGQMLSHEVVCVEFSQVTVLQYIDDIMLYAFQRCFLAKAPALEEVIRSLGLKHKFADLK